jgi:hypothetical protein
MFRLGGARSKVLTTSHIFARQPALVAGMHIATIFTFRNFRG